MTYGSINTTSEEGESNSLKGGCPDDNNTVMLKKKQRSRFPLALLMVVSLLTGAVLMGVLSSSYSSSVGSATDADFIMAAQLVDAKEDSDDGSCIGNWKFIPQRPNVTIDCAKDCCSGHCWYPNPFEGYSQPACHPCVESGYQVTYGLGFGTSCTTCCSGGCTGHSIIPLTTARCL